MELLPCLEVMESSIRDGNAFCQSEQFSYVFLYRRSVLLHYESPWARTIVLPKKVIALPGQKEHVHRVQTNVFPLRNALANIVCKSGESSQT